MDLVAIQSAMTSLKTAMDIATSLSKLRDTAAIQAKVSELMGEIISAQSSALTAQSAQFGLLEEKRGLEEKLRNLEAWQTEKQRYELFDVVVGGYAYRLKPGMEMGEPPHFICANCYQQGRKTILQTKIVPEGRSKFLVCHGCKGEFKVEGAGVFQRPDGG